MSRKSVIFSVGILILVILSFPLLGADNTPFLFWWIACLFIGAGFFPFVSGLFSSFQDKGWLFSKAFGFGAGGYLMFILGRAKILPFTGWACFVCTILPIAACIAGSVLQKKARAKRGDGSGVRSFAGSDTPDLSLDLILLEEMLFLLIFLMWTYVTGFNPQALSTEKFMDYGFMAAMMRSTKLPAIDIWHASDGINYYYGGQYFAVFVTKLTGTRVNETYNIAKTFVAAFTFTLPFSIVWHLFDRRKGKRETSFGFNTLVGILAGAAVSLAGNVHYILYGMFGKVLKLSGYEDYWFPSSTRFIGHNPETADSCIHEFPSYSFVLGDLHAHVVNLIFVLLFLGVLMAWFLKKEEDRFCREVQEVSTLEAMTVVLKDPFIWIEAVLIGIFQFTNYWDFAIYFVVFAIAAGLYALRQNRYARLESMMQFLLRVFVVFIAQFITAAPFILSFKTMQSGIGLSIYHSAFYQLLILWGLPAVSVILLLIFVITYVKKGETGFEYPESAGPVRRFIMGMTLSDMMALLMGICAIGLVIAPEIVYVKDIYGEGYSRANTMFKFTYQAYLMFGMSMIYGLFRLLLDAGKKALRILAFLLLIVFFLTCNYFPYAVKCWFGNVLKIENYKGQDATAYLADRVPTEAQAIYWLQDNVEGQPVILEANGTSYTEYCRVSAMTGLPTVMGWYTHEWLWRSDTEELNQRVSEIREIYTSDDLERIVYLIRKYNIEYIYVGENERETYEDLNEDMLLSLGRVVFRNEPDEYTDDIPAYIIEVN